MAAAKAKENRKNVKENESVMAKTIVMAANNESGMKA